jgi:hypothetical protein
MHGFVGNLGNWMFGYMESERKLGVKLIFKYSLL